MAYVYKTSIKEKGEGFLYNNLHALLVMQEGRILREEHFVGNDECWGENAGVVAFNHRARHDIRSITKSITSILYGIAIVRYGTPEPAGAITAAFPEYQHPVCKYHGRSCFVDDDWAAVG